MNRFKYLLLIIFSLSISIGFAQKKSKKDKPSAAATSSISEETRINSERLFFEGQKEKLIDNIEEAYNYFNQAAKLNPNLDAAFYELAQLQQLAGDYVSAQKNVESAIAVSPTNIWYQQYYGDILASQYKYEEAANVYNKLKKENSRNYEFYYQEAYYLILSGKFKESLVVYDAIENQVGVQPDASLQKHKIYAKLNKPDEAAAELEKLIKAYPDELEFKNNLAEFYLINEKPEKAVEIFESILKEDPNNILALTSMADYYKKTGDNQKSLEYSKRAFANTAIPIDAKISVLYNYIKYYDTRKAEITDAFKLSDILIEAHPTEAKAYAIAGDLRNLDDKPKEALQFYYQSLQHQKDIFTVWQQVFFINSDLKQFDELIRTTNEAKEFFPNQALVYFFNGLGHQQTKDLENAEKAYSRGVKMAGNNNALKSQFYANLGDTYNDMKKYEESDEQFEKALELEPRNAYVLNNYSYYLSLREEKLDKAAEMSKLSNEISPNNSSFLDTYAWILYKDGKYKEAAEWQEKAIKAAAEPSATLLEHLGDILFKLNKKDEALAKWEEAQQLEGGSEFLLKKIKDKQLYE